jgi:hypothetical protein
MRKLFLVALVVTLFAFTWAAHAFSSPAGPAGPVGPPGIAKALAAQQAHNPRLLTTPGVVGTAVGLGADGAAVVRVFVERPGMPGVPATLDGVPVAVQVTGKLLAIKRLPPAKRNTAPVVTITSPPDNAQFASGAPVYLAATVADKQEPELSTKLVWTSDLVVDALGTGATVAVLLADGTHTITASVTDNGGMTGQDTVTITVGSASVTPKTTDFWPRPVPIGVSTGNAQSVSAGTLACRVVDATDHVYALSNTHVFAPNDIDGQTELGDGVVQPGLYDVPSHTEEPGLRIGTVAAYKPINGSIFATNTIDAALAATDTASVSTSTPIALGGYGAPSSFTMPATLNMAVQKFGRTTMLTKGTVTGINATMAVGYADDWYAWFAGQIIVETPGVFEQPGDSGSLVVTDDANANPVGLLFAGNAEGTMAIVNPIDDVLQYFGVAIDGGVTP